jgi:hypothetical protein
MDPDIHAQAAASVRDDEPEDIIGTVSAANGCYNCEER